MKIPFLNIEITGKKPKANMTNGYNYPIRSGNRILGNAKGDDVVIDVSLYFNIYKRNADTWSCIRELKENIGSNGYQLEDAKDPMNEVRPEFIQSLESFLNWGHGWLHTKNEIIQDLFISGNAYSHIVYSVSGLPLGLERIDPRTVAIVADDKGNIKKYLQYIDRQTISFDPSEIIHWRNGTDPDRPLFGESPLHCIAIEALTDLESSISNYSFFKNDAVPSTLFVLDSQLTSEELDNTIDQISSQFKGSENRHKSLVMSGIKEIKSVGVSQKDMEFLEQRKFSTEKVCSALGVPKFLLGYTDAVNNNNGIELLKKFYQGTVQPKEQYMQNVITKRVLELLKIQQCVFVFRPMSFDEVQELEKRGLEELRTGAITLRQYKRKVGYSLTSEDELNPNIDSYIIHGGTGAVLLQEIGLSPETINTDESSM